MSRTIVGVTLATLALYMWGFLYWGLGPYRTMIWHQTADDAAAGQALREHFPENGTWFVPGFDQSPDSLGGLFESGPVAMVHMLAAEGRPLEDPQIMVQGFLLTIVIVVLILLLLRQVRPLLTCFGTRLRFLALSGLIAAVMIDCGDSVWWQIDWAWMLYRAGYHLSAWILVGLVLLVVIPPQQEPAASDPGH